MESVKLFVSTLHSPLVYVSRIHLRTHSEQKSEAEIYIYIYIYIYRQIVWRLIPLVSRSKASVCGCSIAGIALSNSADGNDVRLFCFCYVLCR